MNTNESFRALMLREEDGAVRAELTTLQTADLPSSDVLVSVAYSSLNYKDGLAVTGRGKVVRHYPMIPGIDLAGTVEVSDSPDWHAGDRVLVNGWGLGERHWGGYAQRARVKAEWLVPLPGALSLQAAMELGTAGYTAMLCLMALEEHGVVPDAGPVVITGAGGGVGSLAVALLAHRGYHVVASSGRTETHELLRELGAAEIIDRSELATPGRPLESGRWAGAIDTVGGETLSGILRTTAPHGAVAACGNAGGNELQTTVLPFILRGVNLLGIDSNYCPRDRRVRAWERLSHEFPLDLLPRLARMEGLAAVPALAADIVAGTIRGRVAIDVSRG